MSTVFITGASSGIGAVYARRFAARHKDLVLVARATERLEALAAELRSAQGVDVEVLTADLTDSAQIKSVIERLRADPPIDILVNNAGAGLLGGFANANPEDLERLVHLNVLAPTLLVSAVINGMLIRGSGAIINVASVLALLPEHSPGIYAATKSYVLTMSQSLAAEVSSKGIYVQAVLPAATRTEIFERAGGYISQAGTLWKSKTWSTQRSSDSTVRNWSRFLLSRRLRHGNPSKRHVEFWLKALAIHNRQNAIARKNCAGARESLSITRDAFISWTEDIGCSGSG